MCTRSSAVYHILTSILEPKSKYKPFHQSWQYEDRIAYLKSAISNCFAKISQMIALGVFIYNISDKYQNIINIFLFMHGNTFS